MPLQDRTNEFLSCVESIRGRSSLPAKVPSKQRRDNKSDFTRMASVIGKDISTTTVKLSKLAQREHVYALILSSFTTKNPWLTVAKRKTLFDDRPVEISVRVICFLSLKSLKLSFRSSLLSSNKTLQVSTSRLQRSRQMSSNVEPRVVSNRLRRSRSRSTTTMWSCCCKISLQTRA